MLRRLEDLRGQRVDAGRDRGRATCAARARSCSARRTSPSSRSTTTPTTSSTARRATRTTPSARSAARRAARARRSPPASRRSAWAPTTAARSACRPHFNGVTGLKPGRWVVPYGGHFPPAQAMSIQLWSEIGPMARYVEDLAAAAADLRAARPRPPTRTSRRTRVEPEQPRDACASRSSTRTASARSTPRSARPCAAPAGRWRTPATRWSRSARPTRPRCARCSSRSRWPRCCRCCGRMIEPRESELSSQIRRLLRRRETLDVDLPTYAGQLAHRLDLERAACAWLETNHIAVCPISATAGVPDRDRGARDRRPASTRRSTCSRCPRT